MGTESRIALIVGITGTLGSEVGAALLAHGWQVRALHRNPEKVRHTVRGGERILWINGDAMSVEAVVNASADAQIIVHAANPPNYRDWRGLALPMLENTIAAAKSSGARVVLPGNVYNYGPDSFPILREDSPQHPLTKKGQVRVEMERRLQDAAAQGVRSLIVRAGDFFGPRAGSSWFSSALAQSNRPVKRVWYPGPMHMGHAWAYVPDLAEAIARLVDREAVLAGYESFNFAGHWLPRGGDMANVICREAQIEPNRISAFPWWAIRLAAPFVTLFREMLEMRYLWHHPLRLDNAKLVSVLGVEPRTPLDVAVKESLRGLNCLPALRAATANA